MLLLWVWVLNIFLTCKVLQSCGCSWVGGHRGRSSWNSQQPDALYRSGAHHHIIINTIIYLLTTGCNWSKRADLCVWRRLQDERRHRRSRLCSCYGLGWGTCQGSLMIINHYWHHCHCKFQHHRVTCDHDLISGSGPHLRQGQRGSPHIQPWHRHRRNCSWGRHPCHWFCTFDIINIIFNLGLGSFSIIDDLYLFDGISRVKAKLIHCSGKLKTFHLTGDRSLFRGKWEENPPCHCSQVNILIQSNCSSDALEPH